MERDTRFPGWRRTLGLILVPFICVLPLAAIAAHQPEEPRGEPKHLTCTVRAVDTETQTLEVLTGVGLAVRLVRMQVAPTCDIRVAGTETELDNLEPGRVVRVRYLLTPATEEAPAQRVAVIIETIQFENKGGRR